MGSEMCIRDSYSISAVRHHRSLRLLGSILRVSVYRAHPRSRDPTVERHNHWNLGLCYHNKLTSSSISPRRWRNVLQYSILYVRVVQRFVPQFNRCIGWCNGIECLLQKHDPQWSIDRPLTLIMVEKQLYIPSNDSMPRRRRCKRLKECSGMF